MIDTKGKQLLIELVVGGLIFTLAFAWNNLVIDYINTTVPDTDRGRRLKYNFIYAILFTIITIIIAYFIIKYFY